MANPARNRKMMAQKNIIGIIYSRILRGIFNPIFYLLGQTPETPLEVHFKKNAGRGKSRFIEIDHP